MAVDSKAVGTDSAACSMGKASYPGLEGTGKHHTSADAVDTAVVGAVAPSMMTNPRQELELAFQQRLQEAADFRMTFAVRLLQLKRSGRKFICWKRSLQ